MVLAQKFDDLKIGDVIKLKSETLKQTRTILVSKPSEYDSGQNSYPVIYVLDANKNFLSTVSIVQVLTKTHNMVPTIIVGVRNIKRTWDFTPVEGKGCEGISGGENSFIKFIKEELQPFINKEYRTKPHSTLIAHSLCGMFAVHTMTKEPDLFGSYIFISPYLQYADQYVLNQFDKSLNNTFIKNKLIFITLGDEPSFLLSIKRFIGQVSQLKNNIDWKYEEYRDETHMSVVHISIYNGLKYIYKEWKLPAEMLTKDLAVIKDHYKKISSKFGYQVIPSEWILTKAGYIHLADNNIDSAIDIFSYATSLYPHSGKIYFGLGDALKKAGKHYKAKEKYVKAAELGITSSGRHFKIK